MQHPVILHGGLDPSRSEVQVLPVVTAPTQPISEVGNILFLALHKPNYSELKSYFSCSPAANRSSLSPKGFIQSAAGSQKDQK